jgi:hypothetical protein
MAVTLAAAAVLAASLYARADGLEIERRELIAQAIAVDARAEAAEGRSAYLAGTIALAESDQAGLASVIEVRPDFVAELRRLAAAFEQAGGKVDTEAQRTAALSAQQTVLAERDEPETVIAATATIKALTAEVTQGVAAWEQAQVRPGPTGPRWAASGPDGYARVRAALDRVGGSSVGLYESSSCAGGTAPACANSNGYIKYTAAIATWSDDRLHWAMAHELAHIYQFRVWGSLNASASYRSMFGADPEFLANCMAVVRGYPGSVGCDAGQQAWASGIWVGAVG